MGDKQATDRLSLITPDEMWWAWVLVIGVLTVAGVYGIVRSELKGGRGLARKRRGTAPGQGHTVLHSVSLNPSMGNGFGESSRTWIVPKDPQAYTKGMTPGKRR